MFDKILVPLDGSKQAETVLPIVATLGEKYRSVVTLLHVIEKNPPTLINGECHLSSVGEAESYLIQQASNYFSGNIKVNIHVHPGQTRDVAVSIVDHAECEFGCNLITLCRHSRSIWLERSSRCIARQVISNTNIPVLAQCIKLKNQSGYFMLNNLAVIIDINDNYIRVLEDALRLSRDCHSRILLIITHPEFKALGFLGTGLGNAMISAISITNRQIDTEVNRLANTCSDYLRRHHVEVNTFILQGNTKKEVIQTLKVHEPNLILSDSNVNRFGIVRQTYLPALFIPG